MTTSSRRPARANLSVLFVAALTAVPVIAGRGASQSISGQGTSLQITLGAADVIVTGDAQETVRLSPVMPPGGATASRVSMEIGDDRVVRVTQTPGAAPERRVRVRIEAPASLPLTLLLDRGDARVEGMTGSVSVRVVRGSIASRSLRGRARLEIDTGSISAEAVRLSDGHSLKCRTFNGDVRVALETMPVDARILALTLNGAVRSGLPLTTRAAFGPRFSETTMGAGSHVLSIDVVRGDVTISAPVGPASPR